MPVNTRIACQRSDWPHHKASCQRIDGAWYEFPFAPLPKTLVLPLRYERVNTHSVPAVPNVHGQYPFLVKLTLETVRMTHSSNEVTIRDRQQSFKDVCIWGEDCQEGTAFQRLAEQCVQNSGSDLETYDRYCRGTTGFERVAAQCALGKMVACRWAKRTGDWSLSICLDVTPESEPKW